MVNVIAIQTARAGSKSVPNKNEMMIDGRPLFLHNLISAIDCNSIKHVYMSTDIPLAEKFADETGYTIIPRPKYLTGDKASHYETMKHGLEFAEEHRSKKVDILVVLLGNNRCAHTEDLNRAISKLMNDANLDSVISVGKYNMFNPLRAYRVGQHGNLANFSEFQESSLPKNKLINDKDVVGDVYFFNGSFWVMKRNSFLSNNGLQPFTWLGKKIGFIEQDASCMEIDAEWQINVVDR